MKQAEPNYDVFLSYSHRDRGLAELLVQTLQSRGVSIFQLDHLVPGDSIDDAIREQLVECAAVVLLATSNSVQSRNLAFEAGMAIAWSKPIYALYDGVTRDELPGFLSGYRIHPVSEAVKVAEAIKAARDPLAEVQVQTLSRLYGEQATAVDQLIVKPAELAKLTTRFQTETGSRIGGERVARELMRLRKAGQLPRVKRRANRA